MALQTTGAAQGVVLATSQKSGSPVAFSTGWHNEQLTTELLPRYGYLNLTGTVYSSSNAGAGQTLVAANLFSTAIATFQPITALYNPITNNKNFVVLQAWCGVSADTLASAAQTGAFLWVVNSGQTITNASSVVPVNNLTLKAAGSSAIVVNNAVLTGAVGNPVLLRPVTSSISQVTATANATAIISPYVMEEVAGTIIVPPGGYVAFANGISSTVGVVNSGIVWAELPI